MHIFKAFWAGWHQGEEGGRGLGFRVRRVLGFIGPGFIDFRVLGVWVVGFMGLWVYGS